eukprot:Plantae.Rhodophyta-Purpureofilum_apyrenoidigerum.ctg20565.p1 GENE.Plantae.Rhodophyta-Purpureofilum_apyrenoidigerum.ctg20565~~Plantae.Rhodophyta-Purpureofilum_apyrenoidigerum.ctg20565.p1  ORF type:complete len:288 (+),score=59.65 Plantae.Rhodophyta-Purpureofilum_apyrenoidigerum.ctg20565:142-1005(+)
MGALRIGGVPEHFNLPWKRPNVDAEFIDVKEGSGAMIAGLKNGDYDGIIVLTEAAVVQACKEDSDIVIVGTFVKSRLRWGIHTGAKSDVLSVEDLRGRKFGISREGSGSHLMASVFARDMKWPEGVEFVTIGNFEALRQAVNSGKCDAFMWEKFMTKPYHDKGEVRTIGEVPTPWPCFVLATRKDSDKIDELRKVLTQALKNAEQFRRNEDGKSVLEIVDMYGLAHGDAEEWLDEVRYTEPDDCSVSRLALQHAFEALQEANVLSSDLHFEPEKFVSKGTGLSTYLV